MPEFQEKQFYADSQSFVDEVLRDSPIFATFMGDHRFDDRLADYSKEAYEDQHRRFRVWLEKFQAYPIDSFSKDGRIDCILMVQVTKRFLREFDMLCSLQRNPGAGPDECLGGVYVLILRDFAPLPERMKSILGRLKQTRRVLQECKAMIVPTEVPRLWAEVAIESAKQGVGLFAGFVPMLAESTPELKAEVVSAAQEAAAALQEYIGWIEREVLPQAQGNFAVGKELFDEILREDHMVDYDADQLYQTGWQLFDETQRQLNELAAQIDPQKSYKEILAENKKDHPSASELLDVYREWMAKARQFVIEHEIATLPNGESIRIEPTPPFQRSTIPYAAYNMPGFLEKAQEGVFIVTPVEDNASPEEAEAKLRGHPYSDIPVTALHEAYPGHHLQLVTANLFTSLPRKWGAYLSTLFVEGWAFYCEEMMEQVGFIDQPIQKLARLQAQLWRAARIILDASLHTRNMGYQEAVDFLVQNAELEPGDAAAEVNRYTMSPTQPQSYLMGKKQILEIVAEYKRRYPQDSMRSMHDAILHAGSLPPRLMRMCLFEK